MSNKCKLTPYYNSNESHVPNHLKQAEALYLEAFPPEERRQWTDIVEPHSDKGPQLLSITHGNDDHFAGFVTLWDFCDFVYVEHFAIASSVRGNGIGAEVLALLKQSIDRPIILEVEPISSDNPMAERRIAFYQRNGFTLLDYDYTQPPYQPHLSPVPLKLMATSPTLVPEEIDRTLKREVYGVRI